MATLVTELRDGNGGLAGRDRHPRPTASTQPSCRGFRVVAVVMLSLAGQVANVQASSWQWAHPRPAGVQTTKILWTGERFLAFGKTEVLAGPDGKSWRSTGAAVGEPVTGALVFGDRIVAATRFTLQSSLDGVAWTIHLDITDDYPCTYFGSFASNGGTIVVVGSKCEESSGRYGLPLIFYSSDGTDWQVATLPSVDGTTANREELDAVTWDGRYFLAAGVSDCQPVLYSSPDGRQWTRSPGVGGTVAAAGGGTVVLAYGSRVWRSEDGEHWSETALPPGTGIRDVQWVVDRFVAASPGGVLSSDDGTAWSYRELKEAGQLTAVATDGSRAVVGGRDLYWSDDRESWTGWQTQRLTTADLRDVLAAPGRIVAVGDKGTIVTSSDGVAWTLAAEGSGTLLRLARGAGRWVAVSYEGGVEWSDDGHAWSPAATGSVGFLSDIAWGDGLFVAVGSEGAALTSQDGEVWERSTLPADSWMRTVSWTGKEFIGAADGASGFLLFHSSDGKSWRTTPAPSPTIITNRIVALGSRLFLLCNARIWSSEDGDEWTRIDGGQTFLDLVAIGGRLLARTYGELLASGDGVQWESLGEVSLYPASFAALGTRLVAVGDNGTILFSDDTIPRAVRHRLARLEDR
jgi:hypothetical protein